MTSASAFGLTVMGNSGGEELVLCPFHHDNKPSAWFNPKKELFYCAVCGFGLNAQQLAKRLGVEVERDDQAIGSGRLEDYDLVTYPELFELGDEVYHPYFAERNVGEHTIRHYGVRWKTSTPSAAVLTVRDLNRKVQGVVYRYEDANLAGTRYRTLGKSYPVWPFPNLLGLRVGERILVTEGGWSAMRLHSYFEKRGEQVCVVATMGAKANDRIVNALRPFGPILLYDNDTAGVRACRKMRELAPWFASFTLSVAPDDMNDQEIGLMLRRLNQRLEGHHELL